MISVKIASIIAIVTFAAGAFSASPVPQAIAAIIATDVQCNGCIGTSDLAGNAVTAAKIKDGEVKAAEIATDAVGASEIKGVSKLMFNECTQSYSGVINPGQEAIIYCTVTGVTTGDSIAATRSDGINGCFAITNAWVFSTNTVQLRLNNICIGSASPGPTVTVSIVAYT
jgi:hypothetical protein